MITIENGTFLIGVVLDCNSKTLEPEDILGEYLGIYWNEKVWILDVKDNCNYNINTLFPFSPLHRWYKRDISVYCHQEFLNPIESLTKPVEKF